MNNPAGGSRMGYQRFSKIPTFVAALLLLSDCSKAPEKTEAGPLPVNVVTVTEKEVHEWDEYT